MKSRKTVRENYRLSKSNEMDKLKVAVKTLLGSIPPEYDTSTLIDLPCYVLLEERPWTEGRTWTGVAEIQPYREDAKTVSCDNNSMKIRQRKLSTDKPSSMFDDDEEE